MISQVAFNAHGTGKDAQTWAEKNPVGTGAWQFVSWTKDVGVTYKRFDGYWGGKPYLDEIDLIRFADATASLMAFRSGQTLTISVSPTDVASLQAEGKYNMVLAPLGQVPALAGAAADPYFSQLKVRQAMAYSVDTKALNLGIGKGYWIDSNQWAIPGTWGFNPNVVGYPYNPTKAKQLLTEAGYPNGINTVLHFYNTGGAQTDLLTAVQSQLKTGGINAELDPLLRPAFADIASNGKGFTGIVCQQGFVFIDPLQKYAQVRASNEFKGMVVSDKFKQTYDQALQATDQNTQQKLVQDLMKVAIDEDCMHTPLGINTIILFKQKTLHDDGYGQTPYYYLSPKTWIE
jgi:peptide/nickel transport system substrate-binding protein